jgi:hypothetical protein
MSRRSSAAALGLVASLLGLAGGLAAAAAIRALFTAVGFDLPSVGLVFASRTGSSDCWWACWSPSSSACRRRSARRGWPRSRPTDERRPAASGPQERADHRRLGGAAGDRGTGADPDQLRIQPRLRTVFVKLAPGRTAAQPRSP